MKEKFNYINIILGIILILEAFTLVKNPILLIALGIINIIYVFKN